MIERLRKLIGSFAASRQGAVAVMVAVMMVPLIAGAGVAVDYSREAMLKASLQSIADAAALAGASELNQTNGTGNGIDIATAYFNKAVAKLPDGTSVSAPTVTSPNSITMIVSATATPSTTLMKLFEQNMAVAVSATAMGPGYAIKVSKTGGFSSSAGDANSIYMYVIPTGGGYPTSLSAYTLMFTNSAAVDPNYIADDANPKAIAVGPNDKVGFALYNTTGGLANYGSNAYGSTSGSTHILFSSLAAPSQDPSVGYSNQPAYYTGSLSGSKCKQTQITSTNSTYVPTASTSCGAHPCVTSTSAGVMNNNLLINGSCSTQATATQTCLQLYNNPISYSWNDMGGNPDDFDYNDANYTVSCQPNTTGTNVSGQPKAVILTQ